MNRFISLLTFVLLISVASAQDKPAYTIYNSKGEKVSFGDMAAYALKSEVVLFGELHNNPIAHWMQLQLTTEVYNTKKENLVLGAEMFEADNQTIVDEYVNKLIVYRNFKAEARLWDNFETDYKPLLDFARDHGLPFIASNIPRRYASIVNEKGFDGLDNISDQAKKWIAPLPIAYNADLPGYKKMLNMGGMPGKKGNDNMPKAQAAKDATMAFFILQNLKPGGLFVHFEGAYHSDNYEGIYWHLKQAKPALKIMTISTVEQDDITTLLTENKDIADFIICVPTDMTKTY